MKLMKYLKQIGLFDDIDIIEYHGEDEDEKEWLTILAIKLTGFYNLK